MCASSTEVTLCIGNGTEGNHSFLSEMKQPAAVKVRDAACGRAEVCLSGTVVLQSGLVSGGCSRNGSVAAVGGGSPQHTGSWETCCTAGLDSLCLA